MKYRYTKFTGDELDELDLEDLVSKLSDLLLSSGFGNPYGDADDDERTMQALHDAILDALFNGGVLPEETIERLLGDPADGDQADARSKLEELIQQIIERMSEQGYITGAAGPRRRARAPRRARRRGRDEPPASRSRSPTRPSTSSATGRCAICSARSARAASAATTRASMATGIEASGAPEAVRVRRHAEPRRQRRRS